MRLTLISYYSSSKYRQRFDDAVDIRGLLLTHECMTRSPTRGGAGAGREPAALQLTRFRRAAERRILRSSAAK